MHTHTHTFLRDSTLKNTQNRRLIKALPVLPSIHSKSLKTSTSKDHEDQVEGLDIMESTQKMELYTAGDRKLSSIT